MKKLDDKKKNIILMIVSVVFFLITLGTVWIVHRIVHFQMDDVWYSTKLYNGQDSPPIENLKDIFEAQVWHWYNWGGRSVTHFFLQITLLMGELFADVLNMIMTILTGLIITLMAQDISGTRRKFAGNLISITLIIGMLHALNPDWHLNMYWQSGSANYLHITVVILLFLWLYLHALKEVTRKAVPAGDIKAADANATGKNNIVRDIITALIMIPIGLFSGWSNENMGPTMFLVACVVMFIIKKKGGKIKFWMIEGAILTAAGSALCILAPGNSVRSAYIEENKPVIELFLRLYGISNGALAYLFVAFLAAIALLCLILFILKEKAGIETYIILGCAIISWGAMIMSPHYPDRAAYGTMAFLILAIVVMAEKVMSIKKEAVYAFCATGAFVWMRGIFVLLQFYAVKNYWI